MNFSDRLQHAWNAFMNKDPTALQYNPYAAGSSSFRPDRVKLRPSNEKTIINPIYNRIAIDVASVSIEHVRVDENNRYLETIESGLNNVLTLDANVDQTGRAFIQDLVLSMFDEGCVAVVPVDTKVDPMLSGSIDIQTMRTGKIVEWFPTSVKINLYNDRTGKRENIVLPKKMVAIIENPFYSIMNERNSMLKRLTHKLALMDVVDEQTSSGKLDLIIQLPYIIKTDSRRQQAENRRKDIESQLAGSKYGIAYTDGTEKITQLNRTLENNLLKQIEYLTSMLYSQLGITEEVMKGTADEKTMLNYNNRTVEPILSAIVDEFKRKFLTKTARSQKQSIMFFKDPFKLVPVNNIADIADKFTRNEILTSNEVRGIIGFKPSADPDADALRNKNMPVQDDSYMDPETGEPMDEGYEELPPEEMPQEE